MSGKKEERVSSVQLIPQLEQEVKDHPNSVVAVHRLALAYWRAERLEEAVKMFRRAADMDNTSFEIKVNLGALLFQMGRLEEGIEANEEALKIYPRSAEAHANIGSAYLQMQKWPEAAEAFKKALAINPEMVPAWTNLTTVLVELNELDDAVEAGRKATRLAPTFGLAHNNLAVALYYKGDQTGASEELSLAEHYGYPVHPEFKKKVSGGEAP